MCIKSRYREITAADTQVKWLWEILHSFTKDEMVAFLRFVSGRSRLPANLSDVTHKFQVVGTDKVRCLKLISLCAYINCLLCNDFASLQTRLPKKNPFEQNWYLVGPYYAHPDWRYFWIVGVKVRSVLTVFL